MKLSDKLLVILVAAAATWPLAPAAAVEQAVTHSSVASLLYGPGDVEFRALMMDASRLAQAAGIGSEPVCSAALAPRAPAGAPVAEGQPAGTMERVLAGPVAIAHAAALPRAARESAATEQVLPLTTPPAPSGWQLLLCSFAILGFIALRKARFARG
jgi:hypothetical protein